MIEVTCGACGTALRFAEAEVPPGGKSAICSACKARVQVPGLFSPAADDGSHRLLWGKIHDVSPAEPLTDIKCLERGEISHSVLDYRKLGHGT